MRHVPEVEPEVVRDGSEIRASKSVICAVAALVVAKGLWSDLVASAALVLSPFLFGPILLAGWSQWRRECRPREHGLQLHGTWGDVSLPWEMNVRVACTTSTDSFIYEFSRVVVLYRDNFDRERQVVVSSNYRPSTTRAKAFQVAEWFSSRSGQPCTVEQNPLTPLPTSREWRIQLADRIHGRQSRPAAPNG